MKSNRNQSPEIFIAPGIVLIGILLRFLPHPPNFAPIIAMALFSGAYLSPKKAMAIPFLSMLISDFFIGFYEPKLMAVVYGSFILCVFLGFLLKKRRKWYMYLGSCLAGSLLFFVATNFAVWAFSSWYVKDLSGLIQCYVMGIPFFKNTLLSTLFYTAVFAGAYEFSKLTTRYLKNHDLIEVNN